MDFIHAWHHPDYLGVLFKIYSHSLFQFLGRELSFILLFGLIWCYSMTFVLLAPPSIYVCALQRFGVSDSYCLPNAPPFLLLFSLSF